MNILTVYQHHGLGSIETKNVTLSFDKQNGRTILDISEKFPNEIPKSNKISSYPNRQSLEKSQSLQSTVLIRKVQP